MAQTISNKEPATAQYTVLRAICMAGERVEPGSTVELTKTQYTELATAGKVGPLVKKRAAEAAAAEAAAAEAAAAEAAAAEAAGKKSERSKK